MITSKMTRAEVEAILDDDGNFLKAQIDLPMFAENFFEYGFQNNHKSFYRDEMEELLNNLEINARENGDEVWCRDGQGRPTHIHPPSGGDGRAFVSSPCRA